MRGRDATCATQKSCKDNKKFLNVQENSNFFPKNLYF